MLIMKNTKTLFRFFTLFEYEEEETFLENQHKNGWKVTGYKLPGFYKFEKCDKEEVTNASAQTAATYDNFSLCCSSKLCKRNLR